MPSCGTAHRAARASASTTWSSFTTPTTEPSIGILGGTFDPVHRGHLAAALEVQAAIDLAEVWLMPNSVPPHRPAERPAPPSDRLRMVELAVLDHPGLRASDLEVSRGGVSYTVDTLRALATGEAGRRFRWLLGSDQALRIREWRDADELLAKATFVIFSRPGAALDRDRLKGLGFPALTTRFLQIETPPLAAREIRARVRHGLPIEGLVPDAVAGYIRERGLYRDGALGDGRQMG